MVIIAKILNTNIPELNLTFVNGGILKHVYAFILLSECFLNRKAIILYFLKQ